MTYDEKEYSLFPFLQSHCIFLLSNLLYFLVERLVLDVFHISPQQFMKYSYWGEILIYAVLILVFFTLYKLLWRKEISEPRTATNFKDVLGSLVVGIWHLRNLRSLDHAGRAASLASKKR